MDLRPQNSPPNFAAARTKPVYTPPQGPMGLAVSKAIYGQMGDKPIYQMMADFYELLGKSEISHMFPKDLKTASEKSADFFIGLMGGPPLYHQKHGNPMMRARHLPFEIDEAARQVWLKCFMETLENASEKYGFPEAELPGFKHFLEGFSAWMVNTEG